MAGATVLGSLLVQLGMDSAQFERATQKAQSYVQKMAQNIGAQAKDVIDASNRMGVSVTSFATQVQALQTRLNPGQQALANYRKEVTLLKEAYRVGAITQTQFTTSLRQTVQGFRNSGTQVTASTGAMKSGMQQLSYQLGDVATMWAMGAKPQQIFVSQASQVVQAISLMNGGAGKFAKFMTGPWGMAIQASIIVLSALIPALMKTDDAMEDVKMASNGLADAQSVLGDMFDLTTGKLKNQNDMLRLNAQLMAVNLRAQASQEKASAQRTFSNVQTGNLGLSTGQKIMGALGVPVGGSMSNLNAVRDLYSQFKSGELSPGDTAKRAENLNFSGLGISKQEFMQAIADGMSYPGKEKIADDIEKSLRDGELAPSLRQEAKDKKPRHKKEKTEEQKEDVYLDQLSKLNNERLALEADYTQSIQAKYDAQIAEIDNDLAAYKRNVELNKDLTPERKQTLINTAAQNAQIKRDRAETERQQYINDQAYELQKTALQEQIEQVQLQQQLTTSNQQRRDLDLELLDLQDKLKALQYDQVMANSPSGTTEWSNAFSGKQALQATYSQRKQATQNQNLTPLQSYARDIQSTADNISDSLENIGVDALDNLGSSIANTATEYVKLGGIAGDVINGLINDLIRLAIQQTIVKNITSALSGLFGGGTSTLSSTSIAGAGSYDYSAISGISIAGARAAGGPINAGLPYLVGERGPEIVVPGNSGQVIPNHELSELGGSGTTNNYYGPGAEQFWSTVDQRAAGVAAPMSVASGVQARSAATSDMSRRQRRRIP